ncbi:SIR2 family protein [Rhodococcus sp. WS3]|uniref:SIR2 family protein n=1 Tax=Rhodococcus sp. WS3 TaxID=2486271 RepID=UPI001142BF3A|nr:SIR2 family protein [Rhodococcus sp. WS3]ROZ42672.1 SIR2 family protein [Rhodococcus sp. WS3]
MTYELLRTAVEKNTGVMVVGTGVSIQSVDSNVRHITWPGLIADGVQYAMDNTLPADTWSDWVKSDLLQAETQPEALLHAADKLHSQLGAAHFRSWLNQSIGCLSVDDDRLMKAIDALRQPISTTNYDTLIEKATARESTSWKDVSAMQAAFQGRSTDVMHLHGVWRDPSSIVFGAKSYGMIKSDFGAQLLLKLAGYSKSMIFVGAGAGIKDPNIGSLINDVRDSIKDSTNFHFLLCLEGDKADLAEEFSGFPILPVSYGEGYSDLAPFLEKLKIDCWGNGDASEKLSRASASRNAIADKVRKEIITSSHAESPETLAMEDMLIPPVLLPVAHEELMATIDGSKTRVRCDVHSDAQSIDAMIIVGAEASGLTSALEWVVHERASESINLTPVMVEFPSFGVQFRPMERAIRKEMNGFGFYLADSEPLPDIVVAVDNVMAPRRKESDMGKIFDRMLTDLKSDSIKSFVLGCRPGAEVGISTQLRQAGFEPVLRYIGRVTTADATKLAKLVAPNRASELAEKALSIARKEHLSRTPMTLALLFDVLLRGEVTLATSSATSLLDAYISLLLGRGNPFEDARLTLDSIEREAILASLAEDYVRRGIGSMSQSDAIQCLENLFNEVGWSDDPTEVLANLKARHIISYSKGQVKFTQTSFLHLFAAKRAVESPDFKAFLMKKPLYYAPIVSHYAALTRNDEDILRTVGNLVNVSYEETPYTGKIFSSLGSQSILPDNGLESALDEMFPKESTSTDSSLYGVDQNDEDLSTDSNGITKTFKGDATENQLEPDDYLSENFEDEDAAPFPSQNVDDAPALMRAISAVTLVSNVLRDSELVRNLELKKSIMASTLIVWGRLVELLDHDEDLREVAQQVAQNLVQTFEIAENDREDFEFRLTSTFGFMIGSQGMVSNLASRKLNRALDLCFIDEEFVSDVGGSVMGAYLASVMGSDSWPKKFIKMEAEHNNILVVSLLFSLYAQYGYFYGTNEPDDLHDLEVFLCNAEISRKKITRSSEQQAERARLTIKLRETRTKIISERAAKEAIEKQRVRVAALE